MLTPTELSLWQLVTAQFRLGPDPTRLSTAFDKAHHPTNKLLVGGQGIPIAEFLQGPASHWLT